MTGRTGSWSSSRRGTEYRLIMTAVLTVCAADGAGSVVPGLDTAVGAVVVPAVLVGVGVAVVRREVRIRRRIADTDGLRYWPRPPGAASVSRVGPGEHAPVLPAPTCRAPQALPAALPVVSLVGAGRPPVSTGGAA